MRKMMVRRQKTPQGYYTVSEVAGILRVTTDFSGATASVSYEDYRVNQPEGAAKEATAETEPETETVTQPAEKSETLSPVVIIAGGIAVILLAVFLINTLRK